VNTATGNFSETFTDFAIPGRGIPLAFAHTYSAQDAATDGPLGFGWTSTYQMRLIQDPGTGVVTVRQENGSEVVFSPTPSGTYTAPPRVIASLAKNGDGTFTFVRRSRERFTFSSSGQLLTQQDLNGYTTSLAYGAGGQLAKVTDPTGRSLTFVYSGTHLTTVTDPIGRSLTFGYDAQGNLSDVTDVGGGTTHFTYDASHLLLTTRDPRGGTVTNHYDGTQSPPVATGVPVVDSQTDQLGHSTTIAYTPTATRITDRNGNVTVEDYQNGERVAVTRGVGTPQAATWRFTYDPATLQMTGRTDPNGHVWRMTYDAAANPLTVTDPLGRTSRLTWDGLNDLTSSTDAKGITRSLAYDARGNLQRTSRPLLGTNQPQVTAYQYLDPFHPGDVTGMTDPTRQTWRYTYDAYGDLTRTTDPLGDRSTSAFNTIGWRTATTTPQGHTATFTYDHFGDLASTTDPLGHKTVRRRDLNRNLASVTDANHHTTTCTYDAANRRTVTTRGDGTTEGSQYDAEGNPVAQTDGLGGTTHYSYDSLNRLASTTDPRGRRRSITYDGAGNLASLTDAQGQTTRYTYDAANELTGITYSDGRTPNRTNVTYDANGLRTRMTDGTGTSQWRYNSLGRLTSSRDGAGATVGYGYDLRGQLVTITYPGRRTVRRSYDAAGRMTAVTDWLGHTTRFRYDRDSNLLKQALPGGRAPTDTYSYDGADRLVRITDAGLAAARRSHGRPPIVRFAYARDPGGMLTSTRTVGVPGPSERYGYTRRNELRTVNRKSYRYDAAANVTGLLSGAHLEYDAANELTRLMAGSHATRFSFDARGNRIRATQQGGRALTYTYDQAGRLVAYGRKARYAYNGDGLRMSKTLAGRRERFVWDAPAGLPLVDGTVAYVYGPGGLPLERITATTGRRPQRRSPASILYYHHDQLGSTRLLTDARGTVAATYTYDPYGKLTARTGSVQNPFGYAGAYTDTESGLSYLRARYYDPTTAQFLTLDPMVAATRSPYAYVAGNPLNRMDPTGLDGEQAWCSSLDRMTDASSCTPSPSADELGRVPVGTVQCNGSPSDEGTVCYQSTLFDHGTKAQWVMVKREGVGSALIGMLGTGGVHLSPISGPTVASGLGDELVNRLANLSDGIFVDPAAATGTPNAVPGADDYPLIKFLWAVHFPGNFWNAVRNACNGGG